jgi:hypothetical protein
MVLYVNTIQLNQDNNTISVLEIKLKNKITPSPQITKK